jgi:hypothetical protein
MSEHPPSEKPFRPASDYYGSGLAVGVGMPTATASLSLKATPAASFFDTTIFERRIADEVRSSRHAKIIYVD